MFNRLLILIAILISLVLMSNAQDTEPESTVEATAEVTAEATVAPDTTPQAQETEDPACPALVSAAVELTRERCENIGIGQACYGYTLAEAESRSEGVAFNQPGDMIALLDIKTLQLSALDTATGQIGVVGFKVEAYLPEEPSSTVRDIQFVVFGDTQLSDNGEVVKATAEAATTIYYLPDSTSEIIGEFETDTSELASARLVGDEWVRIPVVLEDGSPVLGWIPVENLTFDSDISILPELTVEEAADTSASELNTRFGHIQEYFFESGVDDAPCSAAPSSGMLIQTPEGEASVTIILDEIVIQLNGTASIRAEPGGDFQVDVLDGDARLTAMGDTRTYNEGETGIVSLNENGIADDLPESPVPMAEDYVNPFLVLLDDEVEVAPPSDLPQGVPHSGEWSLTYNVPTLECPDGTDWPIAAVGNVRIEVQQDALIYAGNVHSQVNTGIYQGTYTVSNGDTYTNVLQVGDPDRITGTTDIDFAQGSCPLSAPFTLQLVNPD